MKTYLIFRIEEQALAIDLECISSVISAAYLTPFQGSSEWVLGLLNFHGTMIPVMNTRKIFRYPERGLEISDQFIICMLDKQLLALWVDQAIELKSFSADDRKVDKTHSNPLSIIQYAINDVERIIFVLSEDALSQLNPLLAGRNR